MKIVLPGSAIGVLGGGENSRMFALAAYRMGYRIHTYSPLGEWGDVAVRAPYEDLDRLRAFASGVEAVTVISGGVPASALEAVGAASPSPQEPTPVTEAIADFAVTGARARDGSVVLYEPVALDRVDDLVDIARSPAPLGAELTREALARTRACLEDRGVTGVGCAEFVLTANFGLVLRDFTPYPHRAGYLTAVACVTGQFEQQLRAVCGLPLGSARLMRPAAMAWLPPGVWSKGEPDWAAAGALPEVKLHLNGPRTGHLTATAASGTLAKQIVRAARVRL